MDPFFGITLSAIVLYKWFRSATAEPDPKELSRNTVKSRWDRKRIKEQKRKDAEKAARKADKEKRRQAEELITVVIPTIKNDGK
jgi:hypothetical protein